MNAALAIEPPWRCHYFNICVIREIREAFSQSEAKPQKYQNRPRLHLAGWKTTP